MRRTESDNADRSRAEAVMLDVIALAAATHPHPNPRVGAAVLTSDGTVVGRAAHQHAGGPHAEVMALEQAGSIAEGSTLVVTLEPCDHHGRTPPCTEAIIAAGIGRVVVGSVDPDARVAGTGIEHLRNAGIPVDVGVHAELVEAMDPGYFHHRRTGQPLVTLKAALTLDGQVAAADGTSQWITGDEARRDAHRLRSRSDAVMVGAGTLRSDDPALTVRLDGYTGPQPRPVIVAGSTALPLGVRLWERNPLVYGIEAELETPTGDYTAAPGSSGVDVGAMIKDLGTRGIIDLLVEGGPRLTRSLLDAGAVDRIVVYFGAKLAAGVGKPFVEGAWTTLTAATPIRIVDTDLVGDDLRVTAVVLKGDVR